MKILFAYLFTYLVSCCQQTNNNKVIEESKSFKKDSLFAISSDTYLSVEIYKNNNQYRVIFIDSVSKKIYADEFENICELNNILFTCYNKDSMLNKKASFYILRDKQGNFCTGWQEQEYKIDKLKKEPECSNDFE